MAHTGRTRALVSAGALYAIQGLVGGFSSYVLVPQLSVQGVSLTAQTGVVALAGVPWVLKLLWAPVVDGRRLRSRPLAVARGASWASGGFLAAAAVALPPGPLGQIAWLWLMTNIAMSLMDVATDAFVIDAFEAEHRGLANAVMLGSREVGFHAVGGLALGAVVGASGLVDAMVVAGVGVAALGAATIGHGSSTSTATTGIDLASLRRVMRARGSLTVALLGALVLTADIGTSAVAGDFLIQRIGWSFERVTTELPLLVGVSSLVSYALASATVDKFEPGRATGIGAAGLGLLWVCFALLEGSWTRPGAVEVVTVLSVLPTAFLYAGLYAWLMNVTDAQIRATHFAAMMALLNLPRLFAPPLVASLVEVRGYGFAYLGAGVFELTAAGFVLWLSRSAASGPGRRS